MSARIMVNLDYVHPVTSDGQWHRIHLSEMPQPGDTIRFLCGCTDTVAYASADKQLTPTTCLGCDTAYRRQEGIPPRPVLNQGGRA